MSSTPTFIWSTDSSSISALKEGINQAIDQQAKSIMIMAVSDNHYDESAIKSALQHCAIPICGGLFPKLINNNKVMSSGAIIIGLDITVTVCNYTDLNTSNITQQIERNGQSITALDSFIIFADALCSTNEDFINEFYDYVGSGITAIGGGTGFLDFVKRPNIFTNEGLINNAVQVVGLPKALSRSIGHGWEILDGPYLVTASRGHKIDTIDYKPAFELYQNVIKSLSGEKIDETNFFEIAKNFPLGIIDLSGNVLVRDPITFDQKSLECVGNIPTNVTVNILKGNKKTLIESAEKVAENLTKIDNAQILMLFDCISRVLYLEENFHQEMDALQKSDPSLPMLGALSLGEIANTQNSAIHLLNKSTVIGTF
ncbi:MAG: FIST signal transduction protein [Cellvibrionaceae bacterium]